MGRCNDNKQVFSVSLDLSRTCYAISSMARFVIVWVRSKRSCYNETSVRYFDIRQFTKYSTWYQGLHITISSVEWTVSANYCFPSLRSMFVENSWLRTILVSNSIMMATVGFRLSAYLLCLQKAKACLGIYWIPKIMAQFCYLRPYLGFEKIFPVVCLNYADGKDGHGVNDLKKNLCYACRNTRNIMVGDPRSQFRFFVPPFNNIKLH